MCLSACVCISFDNVTLLFFFNQIDILKISSWTLQVLLVFNKHVNFHINGILLNVNYTIHNLTFYLLFLKHNNLEYKLYLCFLLLLLQGKKSQGLLIYQICIQNMSIKVGDRKGPRQLQKETQATRLCAATKSYWIYC